MCCCLLWNRREDLEHKQRVYVTVIAESWHLDPQLPSLTLTLFRKDLHLLPLHSFSVIPPFTSLLLHLIKKQVLLIFPPQ